MAGNEWYYNPGDNWVLDDLSGFKIRRSKARTIPGGQTGGAVVAPKRWEPQQPQDFVRGIPDQQVPDLVRPRQSNRFTVVGSNVTAPAGRGDGAIQVASTAGFVVNSTIQIMLDTGENFLTGLAGVSGSSLLLGTPLPATVGTLYGDPIENLVIAYSAGPPAFTGFYSDDGVLAILYPSLLPMGFAGLPAGAVYDTGGTVGIVPGVGPGTLDLVFNFVTQGYLLAAGGGQLPLAASVVAGSRRLYNNGGEIAIA